MSSAHNTADAAHEHDDHDDGAVHAHVSSAMFLWAIFGALIMLTFITVWVSYFDFGSFNLIVAMVVATIKASLVATFFMHLKHERSFNATIFVASFVFLGLLLYFTTLDIDTRGKLDGDNGVQIYQRNGAEAPGGFGNANKETGHVPGGEGETKGGETKGGETKAAGEH